MKLVGWLPYDCSKNEYNTLKGLSMKLMMKTAFNGILAKVLLAAVVLVPMVGVGSTSEKKEDGIRYFDVVVAYEGMPDDKSVEKFEKILKHFACGIYACSQGRHKLRTVTIYSNSSTDKSRFSRYGELCDIRWRTSTDQPHVYGLGLDPCHGVVDSSNLNDQGKKTWAAIEMYDKARGGNYDLTGSKYNDPFYTRVAGAALAHEWGHYHYAVADEYVKSGSFNGKNYRMLGIPEECIEYLPEYNSENLRADPALKSKYAKLFVNFYEYGKLMCCPDTYAYDWLQYDVPADANGYFGNIVNGKRAAEDTPSLYSISRLCFSNNENCALCMVGEEVDVSNRNNFHNFMTDQAMETQKQFHKSMSSWEYLCSGHYRFPEDFEAMNRKASRFLPQDTTFAEATHGLQIVWNPPGFTALAFDISGSMGSDNRLEYTKVSAIELVDAVPNGEWIVIYVFNSVASRLCAPFEMTGETRALAKEAIRSIKADGGTAIGAATGTILNDVKTQFADDHVTGATVFLLSDGESGDNTLQYSQEFKKIGVPIYTFGYGNAASGDLPKLASQTGGKYYYAPSGATIQRAFQEASQLFGTRNQGSSGTIGGGSGGGSGGSSGSETEAFSQNFYVDSTMANLRLTVTYPNDTPSVSVANPIDVTVAPSDVGTIGNETTATYEVSPAIAGMWRIYGTKKVGAKIDYYCDSEISIDSYRLAASAELVSVAGEGRTYRVTANLRKEAVINKANVVGRLYRDGAEVDTVVFDNPANGVYTAYLTISEAPTTYSLSVTADNAAGAAYETFKDIIYEGADPPDDKPLGENFRRTVSVTFPDGEVEAGSIMYVSASRGNDSYDGSTWAKAKKTIQAAVNAVATNGTIIVTNGTYASIVTHDKPLTIKSVEGWEKSIITGGGSARCADLGESSYQTDSHLVGFKLTGGEAGIEGGGGVRGGKLIRCKIEDCHAASGGGAFYSILENCIIAGNSADATGGGAQDCSLRGCTVVGNTSAVATDGQGAGVYDCGAINSIIWGNSNGAGNADNCVQACIKYSCALPLQEGDGNIANDPLFEDVANGDFRLKTGSPCRDKGHSGFVDDGLDALDKPRVMGDDVDIGSLETPVVPIAPVHVMATDGLSMQYVAVTWSISADAKTYSVWRTDGTNAERLADKLTVTHFLDWTAVPGVHYQYYVKASNAVGEGVASELDEGWIAAMLPNSVEASDGTVAGAVKVTWSGVESAATYQVWRSEDNDSANAIQIGTAETMAYSDTTAIPGKTYYYWVRAVVGGVAEGFGTPDSGFAELPAPERVVASTAYTDYVEVTWSPVAYAQEYHVYRSETASSVDAIGVYRTPGTTYMDVAATVGKRYYYWVKAVEESRASDFSICATGYRKPSSITGVSASDGDYKGGVAVTWNAVAGATEYKVYRSETAFSSQASLVGTTSRKAYYDTSANTVKTYYYWVKAVFEDTESGFSAADSGWRRATISGNAPYLVIDLSQGPTAERFPCYEMSYAPPGGFNTREYKTDKLVLKRIGAPGTFKMGSPKKEVGRNDTDETGYRLWTSANGRVEADDDQHDAVLDRPYYIGVFEVTRKQWHNIGAEGTPSYTTSTETYPAGCSYVYARGSTWGVVEGSVVGKLCQKAGLGNAFDLPTEAQWEYACRAGTTTAINNGHNLAKANADSDVNMNAVARYKGNGGGVTEVGGYAANGFGLYDMHGNVAEWCREQFMIDRWVCARLRGGSCCYAPRYCRSASRRSLALDYALLEYGSAWLHSGMRVVVNVDDIDNGPSDPVFLVDDDDLIVCEPNQAAKITIPSTVKNISDYAFYGCNEITEVVIPNTVTNIGTCAFSDCFGLTNVTIGDRVTSIGKGAFEFCPGLTSVTIPDSVVSIGTDAFFGCRGLTDVTIGDGVTGIGNWAFSECDGLTSVTIPDCVTNIGDFAFCCCRSLTRVTIGNGVTGIGNWAFSDCGVLTSVTIGDGVSDIGDFVFYGCRGLMSIEVSAGNPCYKSVDGLLLTKDGKTLVQGVNGDVVIPPCVTGIGDYAFIDCSELTSVTIGDGVTSIGDYAFFDCSGLTRVTIPDRVANIGDYAFCSCRGLTSVIIGDGVTSIGECAFADCSGLTSIVIPDSVMDIGIAAFMGCCGLADKDGFFVYKGVLYDYSGDETDLTIPDGVTTIAAGAFRMHYELKSVTISAGVEKIGRFAFAFCEDLDTVAFSGNADAIDISPDAFV